MGFVKIETGDVYGIEYHGKEYVVNPTLDDAEKADNIIKNNKKNGDIKEIKKAIKLYIPDFPVDEITIMEMPLILRGILKCPKEMLKNFLSPEQYKLWATRNSK